MENHHLLHSGIFNSTLSPGLREQLQRIVNYEQLEGLQSALNLCQEVLAHFPDQPQVLHYLGLAELVQQNPVKALEHFNKVFETGYEEALLYNHAGIAHCQVGQLDQGIHFYQRALLLNDSLGEVYYNLALALASQNRIDEAQTNFYKAIGLDYHTAALHYNLGNILVNRNDIEQAITHYQHALALKPDHLECADKLATLFLQNKTFDQALKLFKSVLRLQPDLTEVHLKIGLVYYYLHRYNEAVPHLERALVIPTPTIFLKLGYCYQQTHKINQQILLYKRGIELFPDNFELVMDLITVYKNTCLWQELPELIQQALKLIGKAKKLAYAVHILLDLDLKEELQFAKKIAQYYQSKVNHLQNKYNFARLRQTKRNKIRIGYVSSNIRNHPNAHLIISMFPNHDRNKFEVYLYSTGPRDDSYYAKELPLRADKFEDLYELDLESRVIKIGEDEIDVLVDLTGYLTFSPVAISAVRVAPVQIRLLGTCGTTGSDFVDYIVVDKNVVLPSEEVFYTEKLIYMPNTYFVTDNQPSVAKDTSKQAHNLPEDSFIFCCFNGTRKLDPSTFRSWANILQAVPKSILWLWASDEEISRNILSYAESLNINCNRIIFAPRLPKDEHLARLKLADLFLDCFHYGAHTTAIDALWVDLPLLTCFGKNISERGAASILKAIGLPELIATTKSEYEEKAIYYATHPTALQELRDKIKFNKMIMPLFDTPLYVKHLEMAFIKALELYKQGKKEHIVI